MDGAKEWKSFWARAESLDSLGQDWVFQGQVSGKDYSYQGPYCDAKGSVRVRLLEAQVLLGELMWAQGEDQALYYPVDQVRAAWPLTYSAAPHFDELPEPDFTDEHSGILWLDYLHRLDTLKDLWMAHVDSWRVQGLVPRDRFSTGVTMHGPGVLYLDGYDGHGNIVVSFVYPPLSGPMPTITYPNVPSAG